MRQSNRWVLVGKAVTKNSVADRCNYMCIAEIIRKSSLAVVQTTSAH